MSGRRAVHGVAALAVAAALGGCAPSGGAPPDRAARVPASPHATAVPSSPPGRRTVFGTSVRGRPLVAYRLGARDAAYRVLVVGVVHGNESAGLAIASSLLRERPRAGEELVVVPDLNPDGVALDTRQNARGVDLNRNFPYRWQPIGRRGDQQYSGSGPLSEPESTAMAVLIRRLRPTVTVWFHQPEGVVDESGGPLPVERRFASLLGVPLRRLPRYHGSAVSWQNQLLGPSAFVVELPRVVSAPFRRRALHALEDLLR